MALMQDFASGSDATANLTPADQEYMAIVQSGDLAKLYAYLERENGLPSGYLGRTAQIESRGNPNARNPNSSAEGLFQFINSTGRQYGLESSEDKRDPVMAAQAAAALAADNQDFLRNRLGRDPTAGELYLAHQQGAGGAANLLANPNAPASSVVGGDAARLNGGGGRTAGQLASQWTSRFDGATPAGGSTENPSASVAGGLASDVLQGGAASDRFQTGMMGRPPAEPADNGSPLLRAIGMALLSGSRQNPLGNLPAILQAQSKEAQAKADREYNRFKDQRDYTTSRSDAEENKRRFEAQFGLQSKNTDIDNERAQALLELQRNADRRAAEAAGRPDRVTDPNTGAVVELPKDGGAPIVRIPGQRVITESGKVDERKRIAQEQLGLRPGTPAFDQYVANGKLPEGVAAPTTRTIKQADGSEVAVQWDGATGKWVPLTAPEGGNAVRPAGAKLTEVQAKNLLFHNRGVEANDELARHGSALQSGRQQMLNQAPGVGNYLTSEEFKLGNQAGKAFLTAILRPESGAVIGPQEEKNYGQIFLPQPGDPASVVAQKASARQTALDGLRDGLGPAQIFARASTINPPQVRTQSEYDQLPAGSTYLDPFNKRRVKRGTAVSTPTTMPEAGGQ